MDRVDLLVIGGGINGTAIARDAAGRGLKVLLVEKDDLAAHTSSASSKLIHGGLRYLEQYEFGLVRESLHEREVLLRTAPHLVRPLEFVLPDPPGGRPWWMIRLGLWIYDLLAGRGSLPRSRGLGAADAALGRPLKGTFRLGAYWDAWVDDARLVVLNAVDAADKGAEIATRTPLVSARRDMDAWEAELGGGRRVRASMVVNAAGPWVAELLRGPLGVDGASGVRLVKGSHIVVPRLWEGEQAYILQQPDGRVVFALPYDAFSLVGTTDIPVGRPEDAAITPEETRYLCAAVNAYFTRQTAPTDVVWAYSGVRSLFDDGSVEAKDVTRDYRLELAERDGAKLLSVFGGKITTARALAEEALKRLGVDAAPFTATSPLPGGDFGSAFDERLAELAGWLPAPLLRRFCRAYGTRLDGLLDGAGALADLGRHFGAGLYEAEVRYLVEREFARTAEDILWRRTKLGLVMSADGRKRLEDFLGG
ncbi:glycerol-3-phosphate dehydrogenase [Sphingosinicella terrae]|uniref:glycerol-3-phosphate dehydrogenase n=1 Tax=Sphingosinicella terrae TaxID=2172047 RepID=UPI000E0DA082|nr:glycerol-3-phosphate dehydrogenase [Sphingosinicella terrae]